MSLYQYAKQELKYFKETHQELFLGTTEKDILTIIKILENRGDSDISNYHLLSMLKNLVQFKPLTPLTGEVHEWFGYGPKDHYQNNRCPLVFKQPDRCDGEAYILDGTKSGYTQISFPHMVE